mgnify:CR=1 FL=1
MTLILVNPMEEISEIQHITNITGDEQRVKNVTFMGLAVGNYMLYAYAKQALIMSLCFDYKYKLLICQLLLKKEQQSSKLLLSVFLLIVLFQLSNVQDR